MRNYRAGFVSWLFVLLCCLCSAAQAAPQVGWWWNPAESGRGFFVESQNGVTFIGAYAYDSDGHATWYVAGGSNDDPYNYTGPLYNKSNGETLFGAYAAPGDANIVGTLSVHFSDDTHGTITWPGGTVAIERQIFGGTDAPFQPLSGWWWNPDESGSGYSLEVQGTSLFIVGFMYDDSGRPVWYYSAGPMTSETTYSGALLQFANGQTIDGPYHPPTAPAPVATLDIAFTGAAEATLTFTEGSAAVASASFTKAGRTKRKPVQPQFTKYPNGWEGNFSYTRTDHIDEEGSTNVIQLTLGIDKLVWHDTTDTVGGKRLYVTSSGDIAISYYQVTGSDVGTCTGTGSGTVPVASFLPYFYLSVTPSEGYELEMSLHEGDITMDINWICTSDGSVYSFSQVYSPDTSIGTFDGAIFLDTIHGAYVNNQSIPGGDAAISAQWTFSAIWPTK